MRSTLTDYRPLVWTVYGLAFSLAIGPLFDLALATMPWRFGEVQWRYGALGLMGNALLMPTVALVLSTLTAAWLGHRLVMRVLTILALATAAGLVASVLLLTIDWLQFRTAVAPGQRVAYDYGALRVMLNYAITIVVTAWVGIVGTRAARTVRNTDADSANASTAGLLVGRKAVTAQR